MKSGFSRLCLSLGLFCSLAFLTSAKKEHLSVPMEDYDVLRVRLLEASCYTSRADINLLVDLPDGEMPFIGYNVLNDEEKVEEQKGALLRLCHALFVMKDGPLEGVTQALTYFNAFHKGFNSSGIQAKIEEVMNKEGKIERSLFTKAMNRVAQEKQILLMESTIEEHLESLTKSFVLLDPKEINASLFKVMVTAMIKFRKKNINLQNFEYICNYYLEQVANVKVYLFDLIGFKESKPILDLSDPRKWTSSSIFDTNVYFFVSNITTKILTNGTFHDVENFVSRNIFPIQFKNGYKTGQYLAKNHILTKLLKNESLNSGEKVHFIMRIIEQADMNLPCTYYFHRLNCSHKVVEEFNSTFDEAGADDRARIAWESFSSKIFNNRDKEEYAMQKLIEQQQKRMVAYHYYQPNACQSPSTIYLLDRLESPHSIEKEIKSDVNAQFCNVVRNCYDFPYQYRDKVFLTMAGKYCTTADIHKEAIDNAFTKSYLVEDHEKKPHILEAVVDYCIMKSIEQGALLPSCFSLQRYHNEEDEFNIFLYHKKDILVRQGLLHLLKLGFSINKFFSIPEMPLTPQVVEGTEDYVFQSESALKAVFGVINKNSWFFEYYLKSLIDTKPSILFKSRYHSFLKAATMQKAIIKAREDDDKVNKNEAILQMILGPFLNKSVLNNSTKDRIKQDFEKLYKKEKSIIPYEYYMSKVEDDNFDFSDLPN